MTEDRFRDLVNREIDGELSAEDRAELRQCLDQDPRLAASREDMLRLSEMLNEIPPAEPPEALKVNIMSAVAARRARPKEIVLSPRSRFETFLSRLGLDHPYSFAAGALAGVALLVIVLILNPGSFPGDKNELTGTIVPKHQGDDVDILDRRTIDVRGASGSVELARAGSEVRMRLNLESEAAVGAVVRVDTNQLVTISFAPYQAGWSQITVEPGEFRIDHEGSNQYDLILRQLGTEATTIYFALLSEGALFVDTLNVPGSSAGSGTQSQ